jgi:Sulfotransferase family
MERAEHASGGRGPVVVLACAYSGVERLEHLLADCTALACTSGTGLLPLCAEAADTWQRVDGRAGPLSSLAASSLRALAGNMITVILARSGGSRWCEISFTPPAVAETFLRLYPETRFLCWHRDSQDVIRAGVQANPWGLAGRGLAPFVAAYPGSSAAAMAAYWAERTEALLHFEDAHPDHCHRVRYEHVARHPDQAATEISAFLGLDAAAPLAGPIAGRLARVLDNGAPAGQGGGGQHTESAGLQLPADHLPEALAEQVNGLQARLGYPPLILAGPAGAGVR